MKRILLLLSVVYCFSAAAQSDSLKYSRLDSLSEDDLMLYYINEPEPPQFSKGNTVGDTTFVVLDSLVIPTRTVEGESLHRDIEEMESTADTANMAEQRLKPKIGLGMGTLGYYGDISRKYIHGPLYGRPAFDLLISQRLTRYLQLDFNAIFGRVGANELHGIRNENFVSEIRAGGVNLLYDFGNLLPDRYPVRPFVSVGLYGFEFLSKTDLFDLNGNRYHYWSDGSIRNMPEGSAGSQNARELVRDHRYESDIRELNRDGFGKYAERAWAMPIGLGIVMKVTDRFDLKLNYQYFLTTTDYVDGIAKNGIEERAGNKQKDKFSYASISVTYDLITKFRRKSKALPDTFNNDFWLALLNRDTDNDTVPDIRDACPGTPSNVTIDAYGCPPDDDKDNVPNYRDDELTTPAGMAVNNRGVGLNDPYWQTWYDNYMNDSTSADKITENTGNIYLAGPKKKQNKENFTVELVRYTGSIPSDELAFLLSIGDINSTTLDDGTTVVYTSGNYDKLAPAIKRRDEFRTEGNKGAGISRVKGNDIVKVPEDELEALLKEELEDLLAVKIDSVGGEPEPASESFGMDDIVYRVQLGAFKNKISTSVFNTSAGVLELKTGESVYRYVTKGYRTIEEAAGVRADLVVQGYSDAFVTAYRGGKRIPMNQTKATVDKNYKEDLSEDKVFNSIDKSLVSFKVQLGPLKKKTQEAGMDERVKDITDSEKQLTTSGNLRYTAGNFKNFNDAEKYRKELEEKGFSDAFIIAIFRGDIISIQEAMELLK